MHFSFSHFEPVLPLMLIGLWALLAALLAAWDFRRNAAKVHRGYRLFMAGLEAGVILLATLFLANPVLKKVTPEVGNSRIILLADNSGSMTVHDSGNPKSRLELLNDALRGTSPELNAFLKQGRAEAFAFSTEHKYQGDSPFSLANGTSLPGATPIGDVLRSILAEAENTAPVASILLFSDGRSNAGSSPVEVAKSLQARKIPLTCIGVGKEGLPWDLSVKCAVDTSSVMRDSKLAIKAVVSNAFPMEKEVEVALMDGENALETRRVAVAPNAKAEALFEVVPHLEGFKTYQVRMPHLEGDARADNDLDYASVEVKAPPVFKVLFLLGGLDWEQRFVNQALADNEQFELSVITMLAKDKFARTNISEEQQKLTRGFPNTTEFYDDYDAVVLDTRAAFELSKEGVSALRSFVENKGGGLFVRGPVELLPPELLELLPVRVTKLGMVRRQARVASSGEFIFGDELASTLVSAKGVPLAAGTPLFMPQEVKSASRSALDLRLGDAADTAPVVCGIAYGAGRVAYSALESTWRWGMTKEHQMAHQSFWKSLILWLSEMGKPRVRLLSDSRGAVVGEEYRLDLAATGDDFLPSPNAVVNATVIVPDGSEQLVALNPLWEEEGRYNAFFVPSIPGEYKVEYEIRLPERTLHAQTAFVARQTGVEADDVSYNEALLRDMARITGGQFLPLQDYSTLKSLPVSPELPMKTETMPLSSHWLPYLLFALCASLLWWARRRIGLR
ncbi:MAG: VWA domain-containing protein [Victivallales bacterium]|nr:VWA domain-containing protein [Victivallales bacterium]